MCSLRVPLARLGVGSGDAAMLPYNKINVKWGFFAIAGVGAGGAGGAGGAFSGASGRAESIPARREAAAAAAEETAAEIQPGGEKGPGKRLKNGGKRRKNPC